MAVHIQEFYIHSYRGIKELKLEKLNAVNILTGDNNSGKTSVLELLSTLVNPQDIGAWFLGARVSGTRMRNRRIYNGYYNMFPIDDDIKVIEYAFMDADNTKTKYFEEC